MGHENAVPLRFRFNAFNASKSPPMNITDAPRKINALLNGTSQPAAITEAPLLLLGRLLSESLKSKKNIASLREVEFKVFSQWGDDGIIQWLVHHLDFPNTTFIEFGVANYREANTRFLMMNDNWSGLVMDGSEKNLAQIVNAEYYWQYELQATCAFIDAGNINALIATSQLAAEVGLLHIDLDGNDYWIWKQIDAISPVVVILEYNAVFGNDRAITVPYDKLFLRTPAHHSNLYFGASLPALHQLSTSKGYGFIGCNSAGNNAYFVRRDKLNDTVREVSLQAGFMPSKFRESRNEARKLTHISGAARIELIRGLPVYNTATGKLEKL